MKNITKTLITFIIFAISFSSCKKYEEGPTVSLLPKKARLVGIWKLKKLTFNDRNIILTDIDRKNTLEFTKEGSMYESFFYNEQYYTNYYEWEFTFDKTKVVISYEFEGQSYSIELLVLRLTNKEFIFERKEQSDKLKMEYEKK